MRNGSERRSGFLLRREQYAGGDNALSLDALTYVNASGDRYLDYGGIITGPFASGIKAMRTINGHRFLQIEKSVTQSIPYSHLLDNAWWNYLLNGQALAEVNAATDPLGTNTACKLTTILTDPFPFVGARKCGPDLGATHGVLSTYIKAGTQGNVACLRLDATGTTYLNITPSAEWVRYQWHTSTGRYPVLSQCWDADGATGLTVGDNHLWWGVQVELGEYYAHSPIINNSGAPAARAADGAYWAEGDFPAPFRGAIAFDFIPSFSSTQLAAAAASRYLLHFVDTTQDIDIYLDSAGRFNIDGAGSLLQTAAHSWAADQLVRVTIIPTISGVSRLITSGWTSSGTTDGTAYSTDDGPVYFGMKSDGTLQCDGKISELRPGYV